MTNLPKNDEVDHSKQKKHMALQFIKEHLILYFLMKINVHLALLNLEKLIDIWDPLDAVAEDEH